MSVDLLARARDIGAGHADRLLSSLGCTPTLEIALEAEHQLVDALDHVPVTGRAHDAVIAVARFAFAERIGAGEGARHG